MSLLKSFANAPKQSRVKRIDEDCGGAVGAGAVAGTRGLLFSAPQSMIKRFTADFTKDYNVKPAKAEKKTKKKKSLGLGEAFAALREDEQFDQTEVISKLKSLETKEKSDARDVVSFGVEDDEGQVVRVSVRAEQAEEFEKALQSVMAEMEEEEDSKAEIAEVLFKLKDHFDIVDVVWPEIAEDEEEGEQQFGDDQQGAPGEGGDELSGLEDPAAGGEGDLGDLGGEGDLGDLGGDDMGAGDQTQDLLGQVIDMMKADAEARKADAEARKAEARQREQEMGAKNSIARIKQEEQMLDMDEQEKAKKAEEKEAKRLAQLSRWKSQMSAGGNADATSDYDMNLPSDNLGAMGDEENEERPGRSNKVAGRISPADLARRILGGK